MNVSPLMLLLLLFLLSWFEITAIQYGSREPHVVALGPLRCGSSKLRCADSVRHLLDFEDLV